MADPLWMTPEAAAERLPGVAASTLVTHARLRQIPHHRYGRKIFFTPDDIDAILCASYVPPTQPLALTARSRAYADRTKP